MSNLTKSISRILKDIELSVRCTPWLTQKRCPSPKERTMIEDSITLMLIAWFNILEGYGKELCHGDIQRWLNANGGSSFEDIICSLKAADTILLSYIDKGLTHIGYDRFKHDLSELSQHGARSMSLLRPLICQFLLEQEESLFSSVHQALCFPTRATPNLQDEDMAARAVEHFLDVDRSLLEDCYPDPYMFFKRNVWGWRMSELMFSHSNGAVADADKCLSSKYRNIGQDARTRYLDSQLSHEIPFPRPLLRRVSKLCCVPKSAEKFRTICMEPCANQYYQHGFQNSLVEYIHNHTRLKRRISLKQPEINRDLAWQGSIDGHLSTIDLSDASDSVSWLQLKKWLFGSDLYRACLVSRSVECELPNGDVVALRKFAGMGSSLTFPIECLVFCALTEKGIRDVGGSVDRSVYHVYGDDIVVETEYAESVLQSLRDFGFRPNCEKTFTGTADLVFRESCGGEYLNGLDVTPVRIPRNFVGFDRCHANHLWQPSCIELANACYRGLPIVRQYLIQQLLKMPRHLRPLFDDDGEHGVFSSHTTNFQLNRKRRSSVTVARKNRFSRFNLTYPVDFQVDDLQYGSPVTRYRSDLDEEVRLYETLRLIKDRTRLVYPEDRVDVQVGPTRGTFWLPTRTTDHYCNAVIRD